MESNSETTTPPPSSSRQTDRLSMPLAVRLPAASMVAFFAGSLLGSSHGGKMAGLRFRAENAHRLPNSTVGWYLYHKSKNYHVMLGGVREGFRKGGLMAIWVGLFFTIEEAVDKFRRGRKDAGSTIIAGLGTAGGWSLWSRFPLITAARTAKIGLAVGLGYGLLQDVLSLARGKRVGYVDFVRQLPSKFRYTTPKENSGVDR